MELLYLLILIPLWAIQIGIIFSFVALAIPFVVRINYFVKKKHLPQSKSKKLNLICILSAFIYLIIFITPLHDVIITIFQMTHGWQELFI